MKDYQTLFNTIDNLNDEFIDIWETVCNIESPTDHKAGVDAVGRYFAEYMQDKNCTVEVFNQPTAGNVVCITMNANSDAKPITLCAHIDTVHPVGSFGTPAVRIDKEYIYGPGVTDCKGGAVVAVFAMTALNEIGFANRPIRLLLQSDEETNSATSNKETINYICKKAQGSIAFLNLENMIGTTAVLWRKGISRYLFEIKGQSAHAASCAESGANAIAEAAHKILELEKMKDVSGVTCNCGIINGGTAPNTVPDNCTFVAEIRFNNNTEKENAEKTIKAVAEKNYINGTSCKIFNLTSRPAMEKTDRNFELLEKLNSIYKMCDLPELTARQSLGGSDAAEITVSGIPCVDSIGVAGDKIHTPEEYGVLSSLAEAAKRVAAACFFIDQIILLG